MTKKKKDENTVTAAAPVVEPDATPAPAPEPEPKAKAKPAPEKRTVSAWAARLKTDPALVAGALVRAGGILPGQEMTEKDFRLMVDDFAGNPARRRKPGK